MILRRANLRGANLIGTDLSRANLTETDLRRANISSANLSETDLRQADLREVVLNMARLLGAKLSKARLCGANLYRADLSGADLSGADLHEAKLFETNLRRADLDKADLSKAKLLGADFYKTSLYETNFNRAYAHEAIFTKVDLSEVLGLDSLIHLGPSTIGIDTIYYSKGKIPESFLRGAGVPDAFISFFFSSTLQPVRYHSCFISYSSKDTDFSERLHADLQNKGVRCWFAPEDLKIGERIRVGIDQAIRVHEKLILVLSEHSLGSDWVEQEAETAMEQERERKETVLFPIRLDEAIMEEESGWAAHIKRSRNIGDFSRWKDHDSYQKAFERLLRDLEVKEE